MARVCETVTRRLLLVVNVDWFLISHRLQIALAARRAGYQVHVATRCTGREEELQQAGLIVHPMPFERGRTNPIGLLLEFLALHRVLREVSPDVVHLVTIKPVLLGGIAARLTRTRGVLAAISGLGTVFLAEGWKAWLRRVVVGIGYCLALGHRNLRIVVQNEDDLGVLRQITRLPKAVFELIPGSGVDTEVFFPYENHGAEPTVVMFAGRLLSDKGVNEFAAAARLLKLTQDLASTRFVLVGDVDPDNPTSLSAAEINSWQREGIIEWWGQKLNMAATLNEADIVVLPSYREGMPKVLLEAAACGRPIVTSDVPGCRDAIRSGVTGFLAEVRNAESLADAIRTLLFDANLRKRMGAAGRALAVERFRLQSVVEAHLQIYDSLSQ